MRSAILLSMTSISTPSCSGRATKQWGLPVFLFLSANTGMTSDTCAPPIHFFSPLITQVSGVLVTVSRPP